MSSFVVNSETTDKNILLIGSPNSGKTTLYNWLTGAKFKTVNYPGATIEYSLGSLRPEFAQDYKAHNIKFIDTPGVYSLDPQSEDEKVTVHILKQDHNIKYHAALVIVDATQMNRQLLLAKSLIQPGLKTIVILTMSDLVGKANQALNINEIKKFLNADYLVLFDGVLGLGLKEILKELESLKLSDDKPAVYVEHKLTEEQKISELKLIAEFTSNKAFIKKETTDEKSESQLAFTLKIDRYLLHPVLGYFFFFAMMTVFFSSIYWMSAPIMDFIEKIMSYVITTTKEVIPGLTGEFLADGLLKAVQGVVIFVPQIFILFLGLGLFENTGYLSRVATLIDGPLRKVGLGGRSFVPMLSGFACAIPAIMATRNISSTKERLIAQLTIPFMSCSARLPVFGLMIGFLFKNQNPLLAGFVLAALYFLSIVFGGIASAVLSKIIANKQPSRLLMDLPYYRKPRFKTIFTQAISKSKSFVKKAGPVILTLAILLWIATTFPKSTPENPTNSYAMRLATGIEPVFKPLGLDGRVGFAMLAAFAAREVFVSSLALSLNANTAEDSENTQPLLDKMHEARFADGSPIFTVASSIGILIFFLIATQCLSTVAVLRKETGGWMWTSVQLFGSNIVAYGLAVFVVQILRYSGF